jgi:hypothetical protein
MPEFSHTGRFFVENRSMTGHMETLDGGQNPWEAPGTAEYNG